MSAEDDQAKVDIALSALDAMAMIWASKIGLRIMVEAILKKDNLVNRVIELVKHGHIEGLYEGRTSHQTDSNDFARYEYLLDCDYIAAKQYLPNLIESDYKASLRAKHSAAIAASQSTGSAAVAATICWRTGGAS